MTNQLTVTFVVVLLGLFALLMGGGSIWLLHDGNSGEAIAPIVGLAGTALGALASMLVSTRVAQDPPQEEIVRQGPVNQPPPPYTGGPL